MSNRCSNCSIYFLAVALLCPISLSAGSIGDIDDLYVGIWSPFGRNWEKTVPICVTGDVGETAYRVRASSLNNASRFTADNTIADKVRYQVYWHTGSAFKQRERLRPDRESRRTYNYNFDSGCLSTPSAKLRVKINNRDINRAVPAIYSDTLLITISPI